MCSARPVRMWRFCSRAFWYSCETLIAGHWSRESLYIWVRNSSKHLTVSQQSSSTSQPQSQQNGFYIWAHRPKQVNCCSQVNRDLVFDRYSPAAPFRVHVRDIVYIGQHPAVAKFSLAGPLPDHHPSRRCNTWLVEDCQECTSRQSQTQAVIAPHSEQGREIRREAPPETEEFRQEASHPRETNI